MHLIITKHLFDNICTFLIIHAIVLFNDNFSKTNNIFIFILLIGFFFKIIYERRNLLWQTQNTNLSQVLIREAD